MAFATKEYEDLGKKFILKKPSLEFACDYLSYGAQEKVPHSFKSELIKSCVTLSANEAGVPQKLDDELINKIFTPISFLKLFSFLIDFALEDDLKKNEISSSDQKE